MKHVIDNWPIGSKVMFRQYHVQDNKKTGETFMLINYKQSHATVLACIELTP